MMFYLGKNGYIIFLLLIVMVYSQETNASFKRPNIIFIIADDLGWNDVGFHGSDEIPTPNIDALAYSGIILNNYYVTPICTPSRSALMTAKYPIHTGMQHGVLLGGEPRGLPLSEKLLPEYLKELGYATSIVGKWHLGSFKKEYTPTYRGFDSHLGFWTGHQDYNDHTACESGFWGVDMRRGMNTAWDLHGQYSTNIFTKESVKIINEHNTSKPLFLYIAHAAVHSGNPYNPLPAPDDTAAKFNHIKNYNRQRFAAMLTKLDESIGQVIESLNKRDMLKNSIVVFTTDNGGPAAGFNLNAASNWPLKGVKNTLWEGGLRGVGVIWSPLLNQLSRVSQQFIHISDWLPTLLAAVGGDLSYLTGIDGINQWQALSQDLQSNRTEILHNIDDIFGSSALTVGDWKLVKGTNYNGEWDNWYGPSGRPDGHLDPYNVNLVINSQAGRAVANAGCPISAKQVYQLRGEAQVNCSSQKYATICKPLISPCLFNIKTDPCEQNNLAQRHPNILEHLESILTAINVTALPPGNLPIDPKANPKFWDHTWTNFDDYGITNNEICR
uniref:Sulfatase N-terminal domain-containing protein n=1 Tax=Clastoptera arizonana TaxID=38151 RepID=A0A1B6DH44_9HEMI